MRLDFPGHEEEAGAEGPDGGGQAASIGLWGPLYFSLWLAGMALAAMVTIPRSSGWMLAGILTGWAGGLGLAAALACQQRLPLQDLLSGMMPRERVLFSMLLVAVMFSPAFTDGHYVLVDGWLWISAPLLLLAVTPIMTRIYLACILAGAWMAAGVSPHEPWQLALVLAFGLSWLASIGAAHFAHVGAPHGLAGWWPIYRLVVSVLQAALPAVAAAVALWLVWPATGLHKPIRNVRAAELLAPPPGSPHSVAPLEIATLLWQLFFLLLMIIWMIWIMLYIRRLFGRRSGETPLIDLLPEQSARMEYRAAPPRKAKPALGGRRGQIVALWRRWSDAMGSETAARREAETAREFTERLTRENPVTDPGPEMTQLLEQAHYAQAEPTDEDLERMRQAVETELSRQSLRRQIPQQPL